MNRYIVFLKSGNYSGVFGDSMIIDYENSVVHFYLHDSELCFFEIDDVLKVLKVYYSVCTDVIDEEVVYG